MGLNTYIYQMQKVDTSKVWIQKEVYSTYDPDKTKHAYLYTICSVESYPNFTIEGAEGYLFKCIIEMYDTDKMMEKLGIKREDGWSEDDCSSCAHFTPEAERPPEEKVDSWFSFINTHNSKNSDEWEHKEIPNLIDSDEFIKPSEWWCILTVGEDLADMRKGANAQFYKDGQWDDNFCPVCSKKILEEHMNKYFDDKNESYYALEPYFGNARKAFKEMIFDHFEDGKGLCVVYC